MRRKDCQTQSELELKAPHMVFIIEARKCKSFHHFVYIPFDLFQMDSNVFIAMYKANIIDNALQPSVIFKRFKIGNILDRDTGRVKKNHKPEFQLSYLETNELKHKAFGLLF